MRHEREEVCALTATHRRCISMYVIFITSNKPEVHAITKVDLLNSGKLIQTLEQPKQDEFFFLFLK